MEYREAQNRLQTQYNLRQINGWAVPASSAITSGKGYRVWMGADFFSTVRNGNLGMLDMTGTPVIASSAVNLPVTFTPSGFEGGGWNLVSNPLPAGLDWDAAGWGRTNLDGALYYWNNTGYISYTGGVSTPPTPNANIIPSMQGFFVKANAASPALSLTENQKATSGGSYFRTAQVSDLLYVAMSNAAGQSDYAAIVFRNGATRGFDSQLDAYKLQGSIMNLFYLRSDTCESVNQQPSDGYRY